LNLCQAVQFHYFFAVTHLLILTKIKKYLPTPAEVNGFRYIHLFGDSLKQAELWAFNRNSVAKGIAIGLFCAFLPMPFEMLAAIFIAVSMGGHLPFAVVGVWVSNPLTWIPLYTPCYLLGAWMMGVEPIPLNEITILQIGWHYVALWLGCLIIGSILAVSTHFIVSLLWRLHIIRRWRSRLETRRIRKANKMNQ